MQFTLTPIITEKSMQDANLSKFTFRVSHMIGKEQIKKTVEKKFNVNVVDVATIVVKGNRNRVGSRRIEVRKSPWKKAFVTLKKGQKIGLFELGEKS